MSKRIELKGGGGLVYLGYLVGLIIILSLVYYFSYKQGIEAQNQFYAERRSEEMEQYGWEE